MMQSLALATTVHATPTHINHQPLMDLAMVSRCTAESGQHKQDEGYEAHVADDVVELDGGEVSLLQVKVSVILNVLHIIISAFIHESGHFEAVLWRLMELATADEGFVAGSAPLSWPSARGINGCNSDILEYLSYH